MRPWKSWRSGPMDSWRSPPTAVNCSIFDPAGESTSRFTFDLSDPPLLIEAPDDSPPNVAWVTLARRLRKSYAGTTYAGMCCGSGPCPGKVGPCSGSAATHSPMPPTAAPWPATDRGKSSFNRASSGDPNDLFSVDSTGAPLRISRRGVHLISALLDGRVRWRAVVDKPLGPLAAGTTGVAVMLGRSLAWFQNRPDPDRTDRFVCASHAVGTNSGSHRVSTTPLEARTVQGASSQ